MLHISYKPICMCLLCFFTCVKLESSSEPNRLDRYMTYEEINKYLDNILANNNDTTNELIIGKSYENRDIRGIKISTNSNITEADVTILLDGGIHAREWVSTVAVLYTISQLLENSSNSDLIANVHWYIFPMLNPDGYIFTMDPNGAIIYPWGFTDQLPADWEELDKCAKLAAEAMSKVNGSIYTVGPTTTTVGPGAGGSDDWAKGVARIKYVYTLELPGLNHPQGGFAPLESSLAPMIQETFEGIKAFVNYLKYNNNP
ncbi:unnamed protein product [Nezara viridula]|uniref:Peptidase M14 domain-containing protein n=1 Tax=Nezara viridula TaxID=85310 RepID=A0A9P0H4X6_NEZVI|nr:unnamed protein product [Nezara viridula]